jgi:hypothetical protein
MRISVLIYARKGILLRLLWNEVDIFELTNNTYLFYLES